jgi:hypothetical protein
MRPSVFMRGSCTDPEAPRARVTALRVLPEAEEELAQAAQWYESKRAGLGVEFVAVVDRALDEIRDAPAERAVTWRRMSLPSR